MPKNEADVRNVKQAGKAGGAAGPGEDNSSGFDDVAASLSDSSKGSVDHGKGRTIRARPGGGVPKITVRGS